MKKFLSIVGLLLSCVVSHAQTTTITAGPIIDGDSLTWINATCVATLQPNVAAVYKNTGLPIPAPTCTIDGTGTLTAVVADVNQIATATPSSPSWMLTIQPAASAPPVSVTYPATGATVNLTTIVNSVVGQLQLRFPPVGDQLSAYGTVELIAPKVGAHYLDTTMNKCQQLSATGAWQNCGTGGGASPCGANGPIQAAGSGTLNCDPNIQIDTTNHKVTLGPIPNHANPAGTNSAYNKYAGLPHLNILTECPAITGLPIVGDGVTDDSTAIQQCIWQRMGICPTFGVSCTPVDYRWPHPTNVNSTGVVFTFPQRQYTTAFGVGCSYFFASTIYLPWGVHLEGVGSGFGGNATQLCWSPQLNGIWLFGYDSLYHLAIYNSGGNGSGGGNGWNPNFINTYVLPSGWGGSSVGDGIIMGSGNDIYDVAVRYWGRHGIDCDSTRTDWPVLGSNLCDTNKVAHSYINGNRGDGIYVHGGDGNINDFQRLSAYGNQLYGAYNTSLYSNHWDSFLGDGNHEDVTTYTGSVPAITSTACTYSSNVGTCVYTTGSSSPGLFIGDAMKFVSCSDTFYNQTGLTVTAVGATSFTVTNSSPLQTAAPTGCSATYKLGTHIWAAAGNTVQGRNAAGGCLYAPSGLFDIPYCEGDQPVGTAVATSPDTQSSVIVSPQGNAQYMPYGAEIASDNGNLLTGGIQDVPYGSNTNILTDTNDTQGGIYATFENVQSTLISAQVQPFSRSILRHINDGPPSTNPEYNCFGQFGTYTSSLSTMSGCWGLQQLDYVTSCTVTAGGTGYTSPVVVVSSPNGAGIGLGAVVTATVSGGVVNGCTVVAGGAGYAPFANATVYDTTGTGATITLVTVASGFSPTAPSIGRSTLDGNGYWLMPKAACIGAASYKPNVCITTGTAAPVSGSWQVGDMVINTTGSSPWAWQCTISGTPGTWTPLIFGSASSNGQLQFSTGAATTMTAGTTYSFSNGVAGGMATGNPPSHYGVRTAYGATAKNLMIASSFVIPSGSSVALTLWDNGVATSVTCTLAATVQECSDTTDSASITSGDVLGIAAVCTGTCGSNSVGSLQVTVQTQ